MYSYIESSGISSSDFLNAINVILTNSNCSLLNSGCPLLSKLICEMSLTKSKKSDSISLAIKYFFASSLPSIPL